MTVDIAHQANVYIYSSYLVFFDAGISYVTFELSVHGLGRALKVNYLSIVAIVTDLFCRISKTELVGLDRRHRSIGSELELIAAGGW
jgi:hypothetical protein